MRRDMLSIEVAADARQRSRDRRAGRAHPPLGRDRLRPGRHARSDAGDSAGLRPPRAHLRTRRSRARGCCPATAIDFASFSGSTMKKVITVVVNSEHEALFTRPAPDRAEGWIHSTRIAEVENADAAGEREKPVGEDGGYLWRLNTYWRLLVRDGGLYIQCESVSLTRGIPVGLRLARWSLRHQHSERVADVHARDHAQSSSSVDVRDGYSTVIEVVPAVRTLVTRRSSRSPTGKFWNGIGRKGCSRSDIARERPTLTASPGTYGEREAVSGGRRPGRSPSVHL